MYFTIMPKGYGRLSKELINYITNLQQENERLKIQVSSREELYEYSQLKLDKSIEYIKKQKAKMYKSRNKIAMFILIKLENILQGENNGSND